jgi:hypothetical protein
MSPSGRHAHGWLRAPLIVFLPAAPVNQNGPLRPAFGTRFCGDAAGAAARGFLVLTIRTRRHLRLTAPASAASGSRLRLRAPQAVVGQVSRPAAEIPVGLGALYPLPSLPPNASAAKWSKPRGLPCRRSRRQNHTIPTCTGVPTPSGPQDCALHLNPPPCLLLYVVCSPWAAQMLDSPLQAHFAWDNSRGSGRAALCYACRLRLATISRDQGETP